MRATSTTASVGTHPVARALLVSRAVSDLGDFIGLGAVLVFAYDAAGTLVAPGAAFAVQALPALLVGVLGVRALDRMHPRRGLVGAAVVSALVALGMALVPSLPVAYVGLGLLGAMRAVVGPLRFAAMRSSVPDDLRQPLLALSSTSYQTGQVVGFIAGGAVAALLGPALALALDAATFLLAALVLVRAPITATVPDHPAPRAGRGGGALDGLRTIVRNPVLALLTPVIWCNFLASALPETVASGVDSGPWTGALMAAAPVGAAVAGVWAARRAAWSDPTIARFATAYGVGLLAVAAVVAAGAPPVVVGIAFAVHGATGVYTIGAQRRFVELPPDDRVAGVNATMQSTLIALEGIGALALGAVATTFGIAVAFLLVGSVATAVAGLAVVRFAAGQRQGAAAVV